MYRNRHARMMKHKEEMKKVHALHYHYYDPETAERKEHEWAERYADIAPYRNSINRNEGYHYWKRCYLSGSRGYAKDLTNSVNRSKFRNLVQKSTEDDLEDIPSQHGGDYRREVDYWWIL